MRGETDKAILKMFALIEPQLIRYPALDPAYSRYNALVRELVSFEQALDRRCRVPAGRPAA